MDNENITNKHEPISLKVADNAVPLCPNCLEPCNPLDNYCPNCDSNEAINPMATYMPLESVRFTAGLYGKLWRKTCAPDTQTIDRCINIVLMMLFCPLILLIGLPVFIIEKILRRNKSSQEQHIE